MENQYKFCESEQSRKLTFIRRVAMLVVLGLFAWQMSVDFVVSASDGGSNKGIPVVNFLVLSYPCFGAALVYSLLRRHLICSFRWLQPLSTTGRVIVAGRFFWHHCAQAHS